MTTNTRNSEFINTLIEKETIVKNLHKNPSELLRVLNGHSIGKIVFQNGGTRFIQIEEGMIGDYGRGLKVKIPHLCILKDPELLKKHLQENTDLDPILRIEMR